MSDKRRDKKIARLIQRATGTSYSTALRRARDESGLDQWLANLAALPAVAPGEMRCLNCLELVPAGTFHRCP